MPYKKKNGFRRRVRRYGRKAWKGIKRFTHDRYGSLSKPKMQNIMSDLRLLKSVVNSEKHVVSYSGAGTFAMKNGATQGCYVLNVSPNLNQGTGSGNRIGDKVKLSSVQLRCLVKQQLALETGTKFKILLVRQPTSHHDLTSVTQLNKFLENDPFYNTVNMFSLRNSLGANYGLFRVIASTTGYCARDSVSGQETQVQKNIFKKTDFRIQWNTGTTGVANIAQNPIYMIVIANNGDLGTANGGLDLNYSITWRYYDN